jgi:hypothetical protein
MAASNSSPSATEPEKLSLNGVKLVHIAMSTNDSIGTNDIEKDNESS